MDTLLFGEYLFKKGLIKKEHLEKAISYQRELNSVFGKIAVVKNYLTLEDVNKILEIQEKKKDKKFGEIALSLEKLNIREVDTILKLQKKSNAQIGEVFCFLGVLSYDELIKHLETFRQGVSLEDNQDL